ncbi:MAG: RDD family protein [Myxococcota bacterium]
MSDPTAPDAEIAYRLAARAADAGLYLAVLPVTFAVVALISLVLPRDSGLFTVPVAAVGALLVSLAQWAAIAADGASLGKRMVGIRILRADGTPPARPRRWCCAPGSPPRPRARPSACSA